VVDDSDGVRFIVADILSKKNHRVMTACCGKEGLKLFERNPDIDLVITDRNMPGGMLGEEVIRRVKLSNPRVKAVLMSSQNEEEIIPVAKAAGADSFLNKDFLFSGIREIIKNLFPLSLTR